MTENDEHVELCSMPDSAFPLSTSTAQCLLHTMVADAVVSAHFNNYYQYIITAFNALKPLVVARQGIQPVKIHPNL